MKIVFIVPYVPNLIRNRSYNLISNFARMGHEVDVFTIGSGEADVRDAEALKKKCRNVYYQHQPAWRSMLNSALAVPTSKPLQSVYSWHPKLAARLDTLLKESKAHSFYDVIHVEHLRGSAYGVFVKSHFHTVPVVWDSVDCISYLFKQAAGKSSSMFGKLMTRFELGRTSKAEGNLITRFDHVLVTSEIDKNALLDTLPDGKKPAPISVITNGVDLEYFHPNHEVERGTDTLIFSGKMSYHANITMVKYLYDEIMPRLLKKHPNVRLVMVGKDPPAEIRKLADSSYVEVTGTVEDIRPFLWKATVAVVPLIYGAGVQFKILEAMATGTAVVTTSKALATLSVVSGKELLVGDSPDEFANCVLELLENATLRKAISEAGNQYVRTNHNWEEKAQRLLEIYSRLEPANGSGAGQ